MPRSPFELTIPRQTTSDTNAEVMDIGAESAERPTMAVNSELTGDLLSKKTNIFFFQVDNVEKLDIFYEYEFGISDINVKGRLKKSVEFQERIGTSKFILDVIKEGYKIVLLHKPEKTFLKNNKSSIKHKHFVDTAIVELLKGGLIKELQNRPHMVNPLTVSINGKGKERLILDLRHVNKQVVLNKIKFENWITLKQYVTKGGFGFVFFYISNRVTTTQIFFKKM